VYLDIPSNPLIFMKAVCWQEEKEEWILLNEMS
jgi:hypothetical protein